jgi:CMP-N,N'-diacetyllegionaminic acid synthase
MVGLIPARGGSKGLPRKNIRSFAGKPLIAHTIQAALAAQHLHRVVVTTDSEEIAQIARQWGADVPFLRPAELAQDNSQAVDAYIDALARLREAGEKMDDVCILQPTSPLRLSSDIDASIALFYAEKADAVISICLAPHPATWFRTLDARGVVRPLFKQEKHFENRQQEEVHYIPNGAMFVLRSDFLRERKGYYSERTFGYLMPEERSIDIDDLADMQMAEILYAQNQLLGER